MYDLISFIHKSFIPFWHLYILHFRIHILHNTFPITQFLKFDWTAFMCSVNRLISISAEKIEQTKQSKTWDKFISSLFFTWNPFKNILFDNNFIDQFSTLTTSYMALHNRIVHTFKLFVFTHAWKHFIHFLPVEGRNHACLGNCKIWRTYSICFSLFWYTWYICHTRHIHHNVQNAVLDSVKVWTSECYNFFLKKAINLIFLHSFKHTH